MNKKTFYVTTPIYYPSGNLHIGHVYTTTLAWVLKNYKSLDGFEVKMLTGADEHGQKIEEKAKQNNMDPQQYVDMVSNTFVDLWKKLDIDFDYFSRTTNPKHVQAVQKQFSQFIKQDDIYKGKYKGLYSVQDEEFLTETQAEKRDGKFFHPQSGHELKVIEEESYFFKMSKYNKWLNDYLEANPNFIRPSKIVKELKNNFLNEGLSDLSVSRSTFSWGVPVLEDPKHVQYVWIDALNNYITALGYNSDNDSDFKKFWEDGSEIVHIVGKEITRFHGLYWPIILHAANIKLPSTILSHGWIVTPEGKMSKSKGNVVDPISLLEKYGAETVKYFFASKINMGQDGVFDEEMLKNAYNADLANNYGNLLSRTIAMTLQNFDEPIKHVKTEISEDKELLDSISTHFDQFKKSMNDYMINEGLAEAVSLGKKLNGYIDITKPWTLKEDKQRLSTVLNNLLNGIYAMTCMLSVVIPNKANEALSQLNIDKLDFDQVLNFEKFNEVKVNKGDVLFTRIK